MPHHSNDRRTGGAWAASSTWAWIVTVCTIGYTLPWAIAATRGARNSAQVFWVNVLLGWTLLGWIVALVMAFHAHQYAPTVIVQQAPPAPHPDDRPRDL